MPVLVTGTHHALPRRFAARLVEEGGEVRVYGETVPMGLRAAGAFVSVGDADDEGRLEAALAEVHTVVHVGGGILLPDPEQIVRDAAVLARAADNAGVRRVVMLSIAGADVAAADPVRRAKAEAEQLLAEAAPPSITVRTSLVDTPRLRDVLVTGGFGSLLEEIDVAPVRVDDLAELVAAFDRARSRAPTGHLVVAADGPMRMTIAAYLDRVGASRSMVGRRLAAEEQLTTLRAALDGPWWSDDDRVLDGWGFAAHEPASPGA